MKRTTAILWMLLAMAGQAHANALDVITTPSVTSHVFTDAKKVGPLVNEAKSLAAAKNYKGALAKLNEAEAVKSTPDEATVINSMRKHIEVRAAGAMLYPAQTPHIVPQFPQP